MLSVSILRVCLMLLKHNAPIEIAEAVQENLIDDFNSYFAQQSFFFIIIA